MLKIGGQKVPNSLLVLLAIDCVMITLGLLLAIGLRLGVNGLGHVLSYIGTSQTAARMVVAILVCEVSLYFNDLYDFRLMRTRSEILVRLLQAFGVACLALAVIYYLYPDLGFGRGISALAVPLILAVTLGWRLMMAQNPRRLGSVERLLIIGTGPTGITLARDLISRPEMHLKVVGFLDERGEDIGKSLVNPGIIGGVSDLESIVERENIGHVVLSLLE